MKIKIVSLPKHSFVDGGDTGNGVTTFSGLKHGQFGLNGIPQGIASDGLPNYVEGGGFDKNGNPLKGEIKYKDYIYSARNKVSKSLLNKYNLPEKYADKKFAEVAEQLQKESENRPNDPVSKNTLDEMMSRLAQAQEEYNYKREQRKLAKAFDRLSAEDKMGLMQMMQQPVQSDVYAQPMQETPQTSQEESMQPMDYDLAQYASGGSIHIKPSKRGTFTAAATKHGKSVQAFASQVLAHPENYSPAMVKKANFARNASKWHQEGGFVHPRTANRSLGYNDTFEYFNNGAYDKGYLNWLNNIALQSENDEAFKYLSDIYKTVYPNRTLTLDKARALGQDKMFGDFHRRYGELYKQYLDSQNPKEPVTRWWIKDAEGNDTLIEPSQIDWNKYKYNPEYDQHGTDEADGPYYNDYYVEAIPAGATAETPKTTTTPDTTATEPIRDNLLRKMSVIGSGLQALAAFNTPADFTYSNALNRIAGEYQPIASPALGGYRRYNPYDINLTNNQNMAQLSAAQRANRESANRWNQTAANIGTFNAAANQNALNNLAWQRANEENRLNTDTYNLGIDKTNMDLVRAYDALNANITNRRAAMKQASAKAADNATTLTSTNRSQSLTNFLNKLGAMGKENMQFALVNKAIRDDVLKGLGNEDLYTPIFNWLGNTKVNG